LILSEFFGPGEEIGDSFSYFKPLASLNSRSLKDSVSFSKTYDTVYLGKRVLSWYSVEGKFVSLFAITGPYARLPQFAATDCGRSQQLFSAI
jgi:hypothetical protein